MAIRDGIKPGHRNDRLLWMIETRINPERRRGIARVLQKMRILLVRRLEGGKFKCVDPHAMRGLFVVPSRVAAHLEPSCWDAAHHWFSCWRVPKIWSRHLPAASAITGCGSPFVGKLFQQFFGGRFS